MSYYVSYYHSDEETCETIICQDLEEVRDEIRGAEPHHWIIRTERGGVVESHDW